MQKTKLPGGAEAEFGGEDIPKRPVKQTILDDGKEIISEKTTNLLEVNNNLGTEENTPTKETDAVTPDWFDFFIKREYRKARDLLLAEIDQQQDKQIIETTRSIAASMLSYYDFDGAIDEYEKLVKENPTNDTIYFSYSYVYLEKNLPDKAISILDRGISKVRDDEDLALRKAKILEQYQRYEEALNLANDPANLNGKRGSAFYCLIARIHKTRDQENEARIAYIKGFKKSPTDLETNREIAQYFYQLNNYKTELFFRKQIVKQDNNAASDWSLLGNCYLSLGLNNLAMQAYEEANKLADGKQAWIIANIGNLLNNVGLYSKAIEKLSESVSIDSSSQYAHERLSYAITNKEKEEKEANEILETSKKHIDAQAKP